MKLCTYNILEGGVGRIDPLAEVIRLSGADVAVIQEAWNTDLFHKLADRLGMDRFLAENPRTTQGAVGLLTRWKLREAINHAPLHANLTRSVLSARIMKGDQQLAVLGVHLHARETPEDEAVRLAELSSVLEIGRMLGNAHVICGDFNSSHPQQIVDAARLRPKVRERLEKRGWTGEDLPRDVISRMLAADYIDTHAIGRDSEQFDATLSTSHPAMRVDFVWASPDLAPRFRSSAAFTPELARFASDHYPVVAEIDL